MNWLAFLSRFFHVLMAVIAVGGLFFLWRVTLPALRAAGDDAQTADARRMVSKRWRMILWHAIVLLLATGIYNSFLNWPTAATSHPALWHACFGSKMILAAVLFAIGLCLTWPGKGPAFIKQRAGLFMTVNVILALLIVALASAMKMAH